MEKQVLVTEEMLLNKGFEYDEDTSRIGNRTYNQIYGTEDFKAFTMWTTDNNPIRLSIDNGWNNSGRKWSLHIDNSDCDTIGYADINYTWQFNKLMEVFGSEFRIN